MPKKRKLCYRIGDIDSTLLIDPPAIELYQYEDGRFFVVYGKEVATNLTLSQVDAAEMLGECIMDALLRGRQNQGVPLMPFCYGYGRESTEMQKASGLGREAQITAARGLRPHAGHALRRQLHRLGGVRFGCG